MVFRPTKMRKFVVRVVLSTILGIPGTTATVFSALRTRNVLSTATLPKLMKKVMYLVSIDNVVLGCFVFEKCCSTYAKTMTMKSNQFHGSRKKVCFCKINPLAMHLVNASKV